jgi:hypothetical protein
VARRTPESLADYLVVAVCPMLIGLLVGSLMFFLVEVFYQGEFQGRLLFVMAMFTMAIVCVARISMEEGLEYASLFGIPLAIVVGIALVRFVKIEGPLAPISPLINWTLMAIVWWSTHKLTWDCTLVDDSQDTTGQGLLQQIGLEQPAAGSSAPAGPLSRTTLPEATTNNAPQLPWWHRLLEADKRPHAPGMWVVYFSLAALPLFGIGGWFVPVSDHEARSRIFWLLVIYVACGLALLLATSFLGLRRYLRQRRLTMPLDMTATWITVGAVMIAGTLLLAAVLPRPSAEQSLSQLPFTVASAARRASRYAMGNEGTKDSSPDRAASSSDRKDESQPAGERQGSDQQGDGQQGAKGNGESEKGKGEGSSKSKGDKGKSAASRGSESKGSSDKSEQNRDAKDPNRRSDSKEQNGQADQREQGQPSPSSSASQQAEAHPPSQSAGRPFSSLSNILSQIGQPLLIALQWSFYAALAIAALILAWRNRNELLAAWQKLLNELRDLWAYWFGQKTKAAGNTMQAAPEAPPRPFAAFHNPFESGASAHMSWPELIRYTFEAVEAWARERHCARESDQTPLEFAQAVASVEPGIAPGLQSLATLYSQLAYSSRTASSGSTQPIERLWRDLTQTAQQPVAVN